MTTKKSTKKPSKKAAPKAESKPVKVIKKAAKKVKEKVAKVLSAANGENRVNVSVSAPPKAVIEDKDHSISVEQAEKIADTWTSHDDWRAEQPNPPSIAEEAWHNVKDASDPELKDCVASHQEKFSAHAEAILKGSSPQAGDTIYARFEQEVARLNKEQGP